MRDSRNLIFRQAILHYNHDMEYQLVRPELRKRGIDFNLDLRARTSIQIDPEKMKQVLINFIQNAADSIMGEGAVTLSSNEDRLASNGRTLSAVVIGVSDTRKGISPEVQKRLFARGRI